MSFERHSAFLKHLLDGRFNAVSANSPRRGGKAEQAAAPRDRANAGVWYGDSRTLSFSRSWTHSARFCNECLLLHLRSCYEPSLSSLESHLNRLLKVFFPPWSEMVQRTHSLSCAWQIWGCPLPRDRRWRSSGYAHAESFARRVCDFSRNQNILLSVCWLTDMSNGMWKYFVHARIFPKDSDESSSIKLTAWDFWNIYVLRGFLQLSYLEAAGAIWKAA